MEVRQRDHQAPASCVVCTSQGILAPILLCFTIVVGLSQALREQSNGSNGSAASLVASGSTGLVYGTVQARNRMRERRPNPLLSNSPPASLSVMSCGLDSVFFPWLRHAQLQPRWILLSDGACNVGWSVDLPRLQAASSPSRQNQSNFAGL